MLYLIGGVELGQRDFPLLEGGAEILAEPNDELPRDTRKARVCAWGEDRAPAHRKKVACVRLRHEAFGKIACQPFKMKMKSK